MERGRPYIGRRSACVGRKQDGEDSTVTDATRYGTPPASAGTKLILQLLEPMPKQEVTTWEFEDQEMVRIGRARDNDVKLSDVRVSRHHLEIHFRGSTWEFVSIGRYGTFIAGQGFDRITLEGGAVLQLGAVGPRLRVLQEQRITGDDARTARTVPGIGEPPRFDREQAQRNMGETRPRPPFRRIPDRAAS